jgi:predicted RNA binding protein YcfA (HicA-like mRNA interferase family)
MERNDLYHIVGYAKYIWYHSSAKEMGMTISGKEMLKRYLRAGWKIARSNGSHHFMVKGDAVEIIPVHARDLGKGLEAKLLKKLERTE